MKAKYRDMISMVLASALVDIPRNELAEAIDALDKSLDFPRDDWSQIEVDIRNIYDEVEQRRKAMA